MQGAGGVGGLLAVSISPPPSGEGQDEGCRHFPCCDANGNITEYIDADGILAAHYEYSPFGEIISQSGAMSESFTHRFSTKPWCKITGLSEYELRKYSPIMGRWFNRDSIDEQGGLNLYGFVRNGAVNKADQLGLSECECAKEQVDIMISLMVESAIKATLNNPVSINLNWDRSGGRLPYYVKEFREYGGFICCNKKNGKVISTGPYPGGWKIINGTGLEEVTEDHREYERANGGKPTLANILYVKSKQCPVGTVAIAFYHSHPSKGFNFSIGDRGWADFNNIPIAGGGISGRYFKVYYPKTSDSDGWEVYNAY